MNSPDRSSRPWSIDIQRDIDYLVHLRVDIFRTIERLNDLDNGVRVAEYQMREGLASGDMMELNWNVASQIFTNVDTIVRRLRKRREISGGKFTMEVLK